MYTYMCVCCGHDSKTATYLLKNSRRSPCGLCPICHKFSGHLPLRRTLSPCCLLKHDEAKPLLAKTATTIHHHTHTAPKGAVEIVPLSLTSDLRHWPSLYVVASTPTGRETDVDLSLSDAVSTPHVNSICFVGWVYSNIRASDTDKGKRRLTSLCSSLAFYSFDIFW